MELQRWKDKGIFNYFLTIDTVEALALIESLTKQVRTDNPNGGREESFLKDGGYFSIAVYNDLSRMKGFRITQEDVDHFLHQKKLNDEITNRYDTIAWKEYHHTMGNVKAKNEKRQKNSQTRKSKKSKSNQKKA